MDLAGRVDRLLAARDGGTTIPRDPDLDLDLDTAYQVAAEVERRLVERGHVRVGRKIGFTNRATWDRHGLDRPIWTPVYDSTLTRSTTPAVGHLPEPRLEPEVVLGLGPDLSIAWAALGVEIVASHHAGWRFSPAEAVADFGVHAALVLGPSLPTGGLEELEVTLSGPSSSTASWRRRARRPGPCPGGTGRAARGKPAAGGRGGHHGHPGDPTLDRAGAAVDGQGHPRPGDDGRDPVTAARAATRVVGTA